MKELKAIQTYYGGYKFRSRLEARWAVFFDACNLDWEYESEGFKLPDGVKYLPDFILHNVHGRGRNQDGDLWVEVKGNITEEDIVKINEFFKAGRINKFENSNTPIIVLGNIPKGEDFCEIWSSIANAAAESNFNIFSFKYIDGDYFGAIPILRKDGKFAVCGDDGNYLTDVDDGRTWQAYTKARQARFEFGETPKRIQVRLQNV